MIRAGLLCKSCKAGRCAEIGVMIACPECNETGCSKCAQTGYLEFETCPQKLLDRSTKETIFCAEAMEHGALPVAGGLLNQASAFLEHATFYLAEKNRAEAELYKKKP